MKKKYVTPVSYLNKKNIFAHFYLQLPYLFMNKRVCLLFNICEGYSYSQPKTKTGYNYLLYLSKDYSEEARGYPLVTCFHEELRKVNDSDFITIFSQCLDNKFDSAESRYGPLYANSGWI